MHAGNLSTGDGPADASSAIAAPDDPLLRTLQVRRETLAAQVDDIVEAFEDRIATLRGQHDRWHEAQKEILAELDRQIGERQRSSEAPDGKAARHAEALKA